MRAVAAEVDNDAAETATADRCLLPALMHHHHRCDGQPTAEGDALKSAAAHRSGLLTQAADRPTVAENIDKGAR